ncbi:AI-2E family transporter [Couchioplanes caeruleus]|uniref:AI-2E family transporter n=1 Tax=Couchioplanes caeruleus TaxID=56438 RepID=UPI0020BE8B11|nr:AI-2E family transporter [Couchioplanes caeruleus]UQU62645.1 AI-2E family transporter [Couchioplanes caeruleus]
MPPTTTAGDPPTPAPVGSRPSATLVRAATTAAALLVLALAAAVVVRILTRLAPMTMAVIAALLLAALLGPLTERLKRWRVPASLAALTGVVGLVGVLAGTGYLIGRRATSELDNLGTQVVEGLHRLRQTAVDTLPGLDARRLDDIVGSVAAAVRTSLPSPVAGATGAAEFLAAALLTVFLLFFFLRDGDAMWRWLVRRTPRRRSDRIDRAGRTAWHTLQSYTHGTAVVAAVDAIGIGAVLFVLRVPLALSLTILTFVSAFVPILGATLAGAAAALVTLVTNGLGDAIVVVIAVIVVQQVEGNVLQPLVMRRAIRIHPVVTLLAVTAGTLLAGVAGALIAVPLCAVSYHAVLGFRDKPGGDPADQNRE